MVQKKNTLTRTGIVALLACVCCILWGSAIPVIKTGYRLMEVDAADTASQIVFAGVRFTLAGLLVLIFASIREKKVLIPDRTILKYAVPVCLAQTVGQYFFFYIGVAHTSGVKGGIITGLGNFIAILMACLIVRNERMTGRKMAGCVLGFAGVVVINLMGKSLDMGFTLTGEGFILISQVAYGISTILINIYSLYLVVSKSCRSLVMPPGKGHINNCYVPIPIHITNQVHRHILGDVAISYGDALRPRRMTLLHHLQGIRSCGDGGDRIAAAVAGEGVGKGRGCLHLLCQRHGYSISIAAVALDGAADRHPLGYDGNGDVHQRERAAAVCPGVSLVLHPIFYIPCPE